MDKYGIFVQFPIENNGKKPLIKNWQHLDVSVPVTGNQNVAIQCGLKSGILVLDVDNKNDTLKLWRRLHKKNGRIETLVIKTPSGGYHYYFLYESRFIDIKNQEKEARGR